MKVKFYSVPYSQLNKVPVVSGQLIYTSDVNGVYYDMDNQRRKLQPASDVLYNLIDPSDVNEIGPQSAVSYTVDTGKFDKIPDGKNTEYSEIEFVFYDRGSGSMFSASLYGLKHGDGNLYTYNWCSVVKARLDIDNTQIANDGTIQRETVYASAVMLADGTFKVTSKTLIQESAKNDILTMTESDISGDNRVALIQVIGRRA